MQLMIWTARLAVACYLARLWIAAARQTPEPRRSECLLWTAGWLLLCLHMLLAFHVAHDWSLDAALVHTAKRTEEVVGLHWAGGLYINFAFALLWGADVVILWRSRATKRQAPLSYRVVAQALLAFIVLNATAVFGPPAWWWITAGFVAALITRRLARRQATPVNAG